MVSGIWERTCRRICRSMFSCMLTDLYCTSFSDYLRRISARRCLQSLQHRDGFDRRRSMRREYSLINDMIWLAFSLAWCGVLSYKASLPKVKELGLVFLFVFFLWVQREIFSRISWISQATSFSSPLQVVVFSLTIFAFQTKIDFTMCGGFLFVAVIVLFCFGFGMIFWHNKVGNCSMDWIFDQEDGSCRL